jgi:hypothetical protein
MRRSASPRRQCKHALPSQCRLKPPSGTACPVVGLSVGMERGSEAWLWSKWLDVVLAQYYWWKHGFDTIRYKLQMTTYLLEEAITALLILIGQMPCPSCHSVHMYALHLHLRPIILRYYGKSQVLIILDMEKHTRRCHSHTYTNIYCRIDTNTSPDSAMHSS